MAPPGVHQLFKRNEMHHVGNQFNNGRRPASTLYASSTATTAGRTKATQSIPVTLERPLTIASMASSAHLTRQPVLSTAERIHHDTIKENWGKTTRQERENSLDNNKMKKQNSYNESTKCDEENEDSKRIEIKRLREKQRRTELTNAFDDLSSMVVKLDAYPTQESEEAPPGKKRPGPKSGRGDGAEGSRFEIISKAIKIMGRLQKENTELRQTVTELKKSESQTDETQLKTLENEDDDKPPSMISSESEGRVQVSACSDDNGTMIAECTRRSEIKTPTVVQDAEGRIAAKAPRRTMTNGVRKIIGDVIDWLCDGIITSRENDRIQKLNALEYFWNLYCTNSEQQQQHQQQLQLSTTLGRLRNRYSLARVLVHVSHCDPYKIDPSCDASSLGSNNITNYSHSNPLLLPLVQWDRLHWKELEESLKNLCKQIAWEKKRGENIRPIATGATSFRNHDDYNNISSVNTKEELWNGKLEEIIESIQIHKAISTFRQELEMLKVKSKTQNKNTTIRPDILHEFKSYLTTNVHDDSIKKILLNLLPVHESSCHGTSGVTFEVLRAKMDLNEHSFNLQRFQDQIEELFFVLNREVFDSRGILNDRSSLSSCNGRQINRQSVKDGAKKRDADGCLSRGSSGDTSAGSNGGDAHDNKRLVNEEEEEGEHPRQKQEQASIHGEEQATNVKEYGEGVDEHSRNRANNSNTARAEYCDDDNNSSNDRESTPGREELIDIDKDVEETFAGAEGERSGGNVWISSDKPLPPQGETKKRLSELPPSDVDCKRQCADYYRNSNNVDIRGRKEIGSDNDGDVKSQTSYRDTNCDIDDANKSGTGGILPLSYLPLEPRPSSVSVKEEQKIEQSQTFSFSDKPKQKRRFWTQAEKDAILRGVAQFGRGNWSRIKAEYSIILRHRTSVQIKDCYRTMAKRGEV